MNQFSARLVLIVIASTFIFSQGITKQKTEQKNTVTDQIDLSEPPFWMFSYDEFKGLQKSQKEFYLSKIEVELKKFPILKDINGAKLIEASGWFETWSIIQRKVSRTCIADAKFKTCDELLDLRLKTLDLESNQNEENRSASK